MTTAMDSYQLDTVRRRRAEVAAHLGVLSAQQLLIKYYREELDEIDSFLAAVEATQEDK